MTTIDQAIRRVRRRVRGSQREIFDQLGTTINTSETEITFEFGDRGPGAGGYFEINGELFYCVTQDDTEIVAIRAMDGSTAAGHTAGDLISIDPNPSWHEVSDALLTATRNLKTAAVYRTSDEDLAFDTNQSYQPGTLTDVLGILGRGRVVPSGDIAKQALELDLDWVVDYDNDLGGSAGYGFRIPRNQIMSESVTVNVTVARKFDVSTWASATDLVTIVGLTETLVDAIIYQAAAEILRAQEAMRARTDAHSASRSSDEVQATQLLTLAREYDSEAQSKIAEEAQRLYREHGGWRE